MNLTPGISHPRDMYGKMVREGSRAAMAIDDTARIDHFYNFCISALSVRDHMYEYLGVIEKRDKELLMQKWGGSILVQSAYDIANSAKHFILRHPKTKQERKSNTTQVVTQPAKLTFSSPDAHGHVKNQEVKIMDVVVHLNDGKNFSMFEFVLGVCAYWEGVLSSEGVAFKKLTGPNYLPPAT